MTDNLPDVNVDVEKMKIAFLNLIMNAIEAMEEGKGILTLTTKIKKGNALSAFRIMVTVWMKSTCSAFLSLILPARPKVPA